MYLLFCTHDMNKDDPVTDKSISRPFTAKDNSPAKQLWTPIIQSCDAVIEINIDGSISSPKDLNLLLCSINVGYRGFGTTPERMGNKNLKKDITHRDLQSGDCNVDVNCPVGDDWRDEIAMWQHILQVETSFAQASWSTMQTRIERLTS